ncbi:MAG: hypothetical protein J7K31_03020 [Candidatus Aenigmarchaeota archaeon]|nr:hypothetical protein [Candidatus Aenigmarchaeota archaeon]RLI96729.1 MAG: hypothetical protein DRO96_02455 [Candidatus Aenigmarchaeota archaeon]
MLEKCPFEADCSYKKIYKKCSEAFALCPEFIRRRAREKKESVFRNNAISDIMPRKWKPGRLK